MTGGARAAEREGRGAPDWAGKKVGREREKNGPVVGSGKRKERGKGRKRRDWASFWVGLKARERGERRRENIF